MVEAASYWWNSGGITVVLYGANSVNPTTTNIVPMLLLGS